MPRYFLTRLRVEGFRGINNEGEPLDLKFTKDAVNSVFAVNANGKRTGTLLRDRASLPHRRHLFTL